MNPLRDFKNLLLPILTIVVGLLVTKELYAFIAFVVAVAVVAWGITIAARYRKVHPKQH